MILTQIFGRYVKDLKRGQCTHIDNVETPPFIRRCTSPVAKGTSVCLQHAKTVTYRLHSLEHTAYFNDVRHAERFRRANPSIWTKTNYPIPK
jgi:hypothetical protein